MNLRSYLSSFLFLAYVLTGFSQADTTFQDSIRKEILENTTSRSVLIKNARSLLLDKFVEGDFKKVEEITEYLLNDLKTPDYVTLYPYEMSLISYWTQNYDRLLDMVEMFDTGNYNINRLQIPPERDYLYYKLFDRSVESKETLFSLINTSNISDEKKDYLKLHLTWMMGNHPNERVTSDTLNQHATNYLNKYSDTKYSKFIRFNIRRLYKTPEKYFGMYAGMGYQLFSNGLDDYLSNNIGFNIGLFYYYKRFVIGVETISTDPKTKSDIQYNDTIWEKDEFALSNIPHIYIGYNIIDNKRLKLLPFAGIGAFTLQPTERIIDKSPQLEKLGHKRNASYIAGLSTDIAFGKPLFAGTLRPYIFRLKYTCAIPTGEVDVLNGNSHFISLGMVLNIYQRKRQH